MNRFLITASLILGLAQTSYAQIYADVKVSHGASSLGTFRIQLHHDLAPRTVANFIGLVEGKRAWIDPETGQLQVNRPYYDGLSFHRLDHDFIIQGGDPLGTGGGGPGYVFQDEFHPSLSHIEYAVSMANSGALTNGSQFFINLSSPTFLDYKHSIFGRVINDANYPYSRSLIDGFKNSTTFPTTAETPNTPIIIESITLSGPDLASFDINDPSLGLPMVTSLPMEIAHDPGAGSLSLKWETTRKFDYPLYYGTDLENWSLAGKLFSMDGNPNYEINIDGIATDTKGFYLSTQVDYSALIEAPQNMLTNGTIIDLSVNGGTLKVAFDRAGSGTWRFIYADGITADDTGLITSSSQTDNINSYPVIPTNGVFLNLTSRSYSRFLSLREITVFLDGEAGPDRLTAIQPVLSFHNASGGWFDGPVNRNSTGNYLFRGEFTLTSE